MKKLLAVLAVLCVVLILMHIIPRRTKAPANRPPVEDYSEPELESFVDVITDLNPEKIEIGTETVIEYTSVKESFKNSDERIWLYDLNTVKSVGCGMDGSVRDTEMYYGGKAYAEGKTVFFKLYDNMGGTELSGNAAIEYLGSGSETYTEISVSDEYTGFDMSGSEYADGLYRITFGAGGVKLDLYFYISGGSIFLCSVSRSAEDMEIYVLQRNRLFNAMKDSDIIPENSSDVSVLHYPVYLPDEDPALFRSDEGKWAALSHKLIQPEWSDERKLLALHDWMTENISYDKYRWEVLKETRTQATGDYTGTWAVYDTHTGVCHDFANIMTIMCREQGIPAVTVDAVLGMHVWNAVYINNKWTEFDITVDIDRYVYGEDVHEVTGDTKYKYDGYFTSVINKRSRNENEEILINQSLIQQGVYY